MITRMDPDTGYNGYGPTYGGADPSQVYPGLERRPTSAVASGIGDVAPGEAKRSRGASNTPVARTASAAKSVRHSLSCGTARTTTETVRSTRLPSGR